MSEDSAFDIDSVVQAFQADRERSIGKTDSPRYAYRFFFPRSKRGECDSRTANTKERNGVETPEKCVENEQL